MVRAATGATQPSWADWNDMAVLAGANHGFWVLRVRFGLKTKRVGQAEDGADPNHGGNLVGAVEPVCPGHPQPNAALGRCCGVGGAKTGR